MVKFMRYNCSDVPILGHELNSEVLHQHFNSPNLMIPLAMSNNVNGSRKVENDRGVEQM